MPRARDTVHRKKTSVRESVSATRHRRGHGRYKRKAGLLLTVLLRAPSRPPPSARSSQRYAVGAPLRVSGIVHERPGVARGRRCRLRRAGRHPAAPLARSAGGGPAPRRRDAPRGTRRGRGGAAGARSGASGRRRSVHAQNGRGGAGEGARSQGARGAQQRRLGGWRRPLAHISGFRLGTTAPPIDWLQCKLINVLRTFRGTALK